MNKTFGVSMQSFSLPGVGENKDITEEASIRAAEGMLKTDRERGFPMFQFFFKDSTTIALVRGFFADKTRKEHFIAAMANVARMLEKEHGELKGVVLAAESFVRRATNTCDAENAIREDSLILAIHWRDSSPRLVVWLVSSEHNSLTRLPEYEDGTIAGGMTAFWIEYEKKTAFLSN